MNLFFKTIGILFILNLCSCKNDEPSKKINVEKTKFDYYHISDNGELRYLFSSYKSGQLKFGFIDVTDTYGNENSISTNDLLIRKSASSSLSKKETHSKIEWENCYEKET